MTLADALVLAYSLICTQVLMKNYPTGKHTTIDSQQLRLESHQKFKESGYSFSVFACTDNCVYVFKGKAEHPTKS